MDDFLSRLVERQHRLVQVGVFGIAALIGFAESRADASIAALVYAMVPLAAAALVSLWAAELNRIEEALDRGDDDDRAAVLRPESRRMARTFGALALIGLLLSILALALGLRDLLGIEGREGHDSRWVIAFVAYSGIVLTVQGVVFWRSPHARLRRG
jgi:hypothetical protein